jgi:hypothetical protein
MGEWRRQTVAAVGGESCAASQYNASAPDIGGPMPHTTLAIQNGLNTEVWHPIAHH